MSRANLHRVFMAVIFMIVCLVLWGILRINQVDNERHLEQVLEKQKRFSR